ncbi:MAG: HAMP domain-containing sensor histidine kinase [Burkholderiaceae bacterium]
MLTALTVGGEQRIVACSAVPYHGADGRLAGWRGSARDVTDQLRAQATTALNEAVAHRGHMEGVAEHASQATSEVVARVSHELRTPLNAILGLAGLMALDGDGLSPAQCSRVRGIEDAGRRLLALVNDMLDMARLEQGAQPLARERVDLAEAWGRAVALVQPLAAPRRVSLAPWPAGPRWAWADARAVEQVLINLLSNAIKYNREGGRVWAEVSAAPAGVGGDSGLLCLSLCDEGSGLDATELAQLFQPFNRLGADRQRIEGTGLGLVIARQLAEAMHGRLEATSRPGQGSRFTLSLPAVQA